MTTHSWLTLALAFFVTRPGRGSMRPSRPGVSALSVVALCNKDQSTTLNEYSRLVVYILTPGQHVTTHPWLRGSFQGHTRIIAVTTRSWLRGDVSVPQTCPGRLFPHTTSPTTSQRDMYIRQGMSMYDTDELTFGQSTYMRVLPYSQTKAGRSRTHLPCRLV